MREFSVPSKVPNPTEHSVSDYVFDNAASYPNRVAMRRKTGSSWLDVTAGQVGDEVLALAKGFVAAGIARGDRVALMSKTRYEWTITDFALFAVGAIVVPVYETSSAEQVEWILADSEARAIIVETAAHEAIVESVRANTPALANVWRIENDAIGELSAKGKALADEEVHSRRAALTLDDPASIIYTSGTTGKPKGCLLTHRNFVTEISEVLAGLGDLFNENTSTLLFLPIAHVFGRVIEIGAIASGCVLGHTPDVKTLIEDMGTFQPVFVLSVPRVFEKVYNTAKQKAHSEGKGKIFDRADQVAIAYSRALDTDKVPLALKVQHAIFDRLVYRKIRAALGGRCEAAISGGAPLGERLGHFFRGIGVTIYEGYGLTETTAGICVNLQDALKIGTVGRPVPGHTAKIADDGELLFKGNLIFRGYWRNDDASKEAMDADGWFHTGDLGEIDDDGFVKITGRKKEIIVTAGGKNVAPAVLEDRIRSHWLVSQCLVVGDQKPFVAALITIDAEAFPTWLKQQEKPETTTVADVVDDPALRAEIQEAVDSANKSVSRAEAIKKFVILPKDWSEADGQITPSLKLKRRVVMNEHAADIEKLYAR